MFPFIFHEKQMFVSTRERFVAVGLKHRLHNLIQNNIRFFIWLHVLHLPYLFQVYIQFPNNFQRTVNCAGFFSANLLLSIITIIVFHLSSCCKLQYILRTLALCISVAFCIADIFSLVIYRNILTWEMIVIIGTSNRNESRGFLRAYLFNYKFFISSMDVTL